MKFFEAPEPVEEDVDDYAQPAWFGPPQRVLGRVVPLSTFVARSDQAVVALTHATVYPTGCALALEIAGRRGKMDLQEWWGFRENVFSRAHGGSHTPGELPDGMLRFGARFSDGSKATTVVRRFGPTSDDPPDGPVLTDLHGSGSNGPHDFDLTRQLWLWPIPAPEPFEFAVEWPLLGIPLTFVTLDGAALASAADQAQPYWT
jgi:hypothetical protein